MTELRFATAVGLALALLAGCGPRPVPPLQLLGVWHPVEPGDTVEAVAARYGADPEVLAELNDLPASGAIEGRERIFVPKAGGEPPGTGAEPPPPYRGGAVDEPATPAPAAAAADGGAGSCSGGADRCLAWPLDGEVGARFGSRGGKQHDGIDIVAPAGTPVRAAAAGTVLYSGDEIKGYGNLVIVRHADAIITVYAHNAKNLVREGDDVRRGQAVAQVGRTGSATVDHLHFEVRVDERPRDPLEYLTAKEGAK